ncbi:hypothetical protein BM613_09375 [Sulfoacidibacillus thermotolerans]|uniref:Cell envelope-related transcriptional attenuator domain-containing protein n=1 Tax=Sulfoacidibacillus thermotolerans TaxID=1765684 RepID=A0A2U3D7P1_SULT2|nr:hypothetical protein BM613_09375 [Sulfoacidibacillus thermotolerans]
MHGRNGVWAIFVVFVVAIGGILVSARVYNPAVHVQFTGRSGNTVTTQRQLQGFVKTVPPDPEQLLENRLRQALEDLAQGNQVRDPSTVLLIGTDSRHGEAARSDAMLLTRIHFAQKRALVVSLPRDTRVYIPRYGYTKINHALAFGDLPLLKHTVERVFGVPIDHAVVVDFAGFIELIDVLGGVQVHLEKALDYDDATDGTHIHLRPGQQRLDGKEALDYVRFRHDAFADTGRMQRQRNLLHAIASTPIPIERWWALGMALPRLSRHIRSDLSEFALLSEVAKIALTSKWTVTTEGLRGKNKVDPTDGLWYFYLDDDGLKQWRREWMAFDTAVVPSKENAKASEQSSRER